MSFRAVPRALPRSHAFLHPRPPTAFNRSYATIRDDLPLVKFPPPTGARKPRIPKAPRRFNPDASKPKTTTPASSESSSEFPPPSKVPLYLGVGAFLYMGGTVLWNNYPRKRRSGSAGTGAATTAGPGVHHADAPLPSHHLPSVVVTESDPKTGAETVDLVPSGTTSVPPFPRTLKLEDGVYHLLGLGIRTVSFLNIQVYVVGFYVHQNDLPGLQKAVLKRVVGEQATAATMIERDQMRKVLLDGGEEGERVWREVLMNMEGEGWRSAWRIVPTRNTDFQHLRDGWVRGIQSRTKAASPASPTTVPTSSLSNPTSSSTALTFDDEPFESAMRSFKSVVGIKKSVPKQKTLLLHRDARGALSVLFDPSGKNDGTLGPETVNMGKVEDKRISALLWLNYLAGDKVASKGARESVVDGVVGMAERPAGVQVGA